MRRHTTAATEQGKFNIKHSEVMAAEYRDFPGNRKNSGAQTRALHSRDTNRYIWREHCGQLPGGPDGEPPSLQYPVLPPLAPLRGNSPLKKSPPPLPDLTFSPGPSVAGIKTRQRGEW